MAVPVLFLFILDGTMVIGHTIKLTLQSGPDMVILVAIHGRAPDAAAPDPCLTVRSVKSIIYQAAYDTII